ncbi:MAG: hypothetical protein WDN50_25885 [Bradyrhizobium sp.]
MKLSASAMLVSLLALIPGAAPALAEVEQCRFIQAKPDREACYRRQEAALAEKTPARGQPGFRKCWGHGIAGADEARGHGAQQAVAQHLPGMLSAFSKRSFL